MCNREAFQVTEARSHGLQPAIITGVPSRGCLIVQSMENTVSEFGLRGKLSLEAMQT